jgi:hypothetical protein
MLECNRGFTNEKMIVSKIIAAVEQAAGVRRRWLKSASTTYQWPTKMIRRIFIASVIAMLPGVLFCRTLPVQNAHSSKLKIRVMTYNIHVGVGMDNAWTSKESPR